MGAIDKLACYGLFSVMRLFKRIAVCISFYKLPVCIFSYNDVLKSLLMFKSLLQLFYQSRRVCGRNFSIWGMLKRFMVYCRQAE